MQITIDKGVVDDNTKLSAADYREMLYRDINNRRKESRRAEQARQSSGRATAPMNEKTAWAADQKLLRLLLIVFVQSKFYVL